VGFSTVENADVTLYHGDKREFVFGKDAKSKMLTGMSKYIGKNENLYVYIQIKDENKRLNVKFDSYIEVGPENIWERKYASIIENPNT